MQLKYNKTTEESTFFDDLFSLLFPPIIAFAVLYIGGHVAIAIANGIL